MVHHLYCAVYRTFYEPIMKTGQKTLHINRPIKWHGAGEVTLNFFHPSKLRGSQQTGYDILVNYLKFFMNIPNISSLKKTLQCITV